MSIVRRAAHAASLALLVSVLPSPVSVQLSAQEPAQEPASYARIERPETALRCFPTSYSPVFDEVLAEGEIVVPTGDERNGFRAVRLPLGVAGYVHSSFAEIGEDGVVKSRGARVAFRYRPNSGEAPVRLVEDGTAFRLLAIEGDWIRVRAADQPAWVAADAVVVFPAAEAVETVVAGWRSLGERQEQQVAEAVAGLRDREAAAAREIEQRERLTAVAASYREEIAKPDVDQEVGGLRDTAAALVEEFETGTDLHAEASRLLTEIERHQRALAMLALVAETPPERPAASAEAAAPTDPLGDFATGWLRASGGLFSPKRYTLEKGGLVLFELECKTGRYTLDVFEGLEVAVRGPAARPDPDSMRSLDVRRIEVLATPRR